MMFSVAQMQKITNSDEIYPYYKSKQIICCICLMDGNNKNVNEVMATSICKVIPYDLYYSCFNHSIGRMYRYTIISILCHQLI